MNPNKPLKPLPLGEGFIAIFNRVRWIALAMTHFLGVIGAYINSR